MRCQQAAVTGVDLERRVAHTRAAADVPYNRLVLATGSENNYFGDPALQAHTLSRKTLPEAQRLRDHVLACLERAAHAAVRPRDRDLRGAGRGHR